MRLLLSFILSLGILSSPAFSQKVVASWYGPGFHGKRTASGERFNQYALTAAHKHLRFGTLVRVTYKGRSVIVRINDRGPYAHGRTLDLSKGAARKIGCKGTCVVSMQIVKTGKKRSA